MEQNIQRENCRRVGKQERKLLGDESQGQEKRPKVTSTRNGMGGEREREQWLNHGGNQDDHTSSNKY